MGLFRYLRQRREYAKLARATRPGDVAAAEAQKAVGDSVLRVLKGHGIDPSRPDPTRLMDPEVQRALRDAVLRPEAGEGG